MEDIAGALRKAEMRRQLATVERNAAAKHMRDIMLAAVDAGWTRVKIGEEAGISRENVYRILREG